MRSTKLRGALPTLAIVLLLVVSTTAAAAFVGGPNHAKKNSTANGSYEVDFNGCSSVNIVADGKDDLPYDATITYYNASSGAVEDVTVTITGDNTKKIPGRYGDRPVYQFDVHEHVGESESGDSKILSVTIGQQTWVNENRCAENVPETPDDDVDPDDLRLTAICTDEKDGLATFRIRNANDEAVTVEYDVYGGDAKKSVVVPAEGEVFVTVNTTESGPTTVRLFYDDEQVDVKASNPSACDLGEPNVDADKIRLTAICTDKEDDFAKFRVTNDNDEAVTVEYDVYGTDVNGTLDVPANDTVYFTVPTDDDGSATVRLFYENEQIDVKASNTRERCDLGEENEDAYQVDLAFGEVIEDLGEDENAFYGKQGRLIQARAFAENGTVTGSHDVPWEDGSATVTKDGCAVTYTVIQYDETTGKATVEVSVADDADCDGVQVTFAGYELPDGTTKFDRDRADEQELVDHVTTEIDAGETKTLVIDLDD